jgi:small subunit ribosomal protein S16
LPSDHADRLKIDADRAKYWLGCGAQPTDRVTLLMARLGLVEKPAQKVNTKKAEPKTKAKERAAMEAQKAEEAAAASASAE